MVLAEWGLGDTVKVALGSLKSGNRHRSPYLLWERGRVAWAVGTGVLSCRQQPLATASSGHWEDSQVSASEQDATSAATQRWSDSGVPPFWRPSPSSCSPLFLDWAAASLLAPPKARVPFLSFIHTAGTWKLDWKLDPERKLCSLCPQMSFPWYVWVFRIHPSAYTPSGKQPAFPRHPAPVPSGSG